MELVLVPISFPVCSVLAYVMLNRVSFTTSSLRHMTSLILFHRRTNSDNSFVVVVAAVGTH